ncbi:hypothetical protein [Streptomyces sp. GZWMJZ-114]|uniref:hypothetical protein n=1 Tax=Streptomyces sp. GZWMJZ-114 TaxID=2494734 RepID=UPI001012CDC5|nr:hypothetical protein [Streptomyces sp. GZWMJZ-114]
MLTADCGAVTHVGRRRSVTTAMLVQDTTLGPHTPLFCARAPHDRAESPHMAYLGRPSGTEADSYTAPCGPDRYGTWWVWQEEAPGAGRPMVERACRRTPAACLLPAHHIDNCSPFPRSALFRGLHPRELAAMERLAAGVPRADLPELLGWPEAVVADVVRRVMGAVGARRRAHMIHALLRLQQIRPPATTIQERFPDLDDEGQDLVLALATSPYSHLAEAVGLPTQELRSQLATLRQAARANSSEHLVGLAHAWDVPCLREAP